MAFSYFRNRAIKSYARELPRLLNKRYGNSKHYTKGQVLRTVEYAGLSKKYVNYAYGLFCGFDQFQQSLEQNKYFKEVKGYLAEKYFGGDADFSTADVHGINASFLGDGIGGGGSDGAGN
ncbi:hypothetical protein FKG94_11320 [Exilibacterium tricleocarpae]|uniref:Uncharacterized protein n=1 Tax=Exilibacterium tricleocarpae TaxID=2591008 RepID=A0A545TQQ5_9GAMM|nr:DUF6559 family protein [Exilibacterium tricleocarpae]TQV79451.1 hypothetical protein FKG94_11320 [Exilibacterium tricleocarpae]